MQARTYFKAGLALAMEEAKAEGPAYEGPQPEDVAHAIEAALLKAHGEPAPEC